MAIPSPRDTVEEEWREIWDFPGYEISSHGRARSRLTGRILAPSVNQRHLVHVGPVRDGKQIRRAVALLVAEAFLPEPPPAFDTPIHLDGDKMNNFASNLAWRPRWFALRHSQQFSSYRLGPVFPIEEVTTGEYFPDVWDAVIKYGLLVHEVRSATPRSSEVWPTRQRFRYV